MKPYLWAAEGTVYYLLMCFCTYHFRCAPLTWFVILGCVILSIVDMWDAIKSSP